MDSRADALEEDMVERVARAFYENFFTDDWPPETAPGLGFDAQNVRLAAIKAIRSMREPTEAMKALDQSLAQYWHTGTVPPTLTCKLGSHTGASWSQMIDCALQAERSEGGSP